MTEAASSSSSLSAAAGLGADGARSTPEPALLLTIRPSLSIPDIHLDLLSPSTTRVAKLKQQVRERLGPTYARHRIRLIYHGRILADSAVLGAVVKPPPPPPRDDDDVFTRAGSAGGKAAGKGKGMSLLGTGKGKGKADAARRSAGDDEEGTEMDELLPKGRQDEEKPSGDPQPSAKAKGKKPLPAPIRVFINASIGDILPSGDLDAERKLASQPVLPSTSTPRPTRHPGGVGPAGEGPSSAASQGQQHAPSSTTLPAPRGFDRLLSTGFTRSEVSALRLQFRSIQASRHTADTMPSPDTLRNMEDAWIDSNAFEPTAGGGDPFSSTNAPAAPTAGWTSWFGGGGAAAAGNGGMEDTSDEPHRLLDILIPAMAIGFFFPLGTFGWLIRQEGLWSPKWQFLALLGFFSSLLIGVVRNLAGET